MTVPSLSLQECSVLNRDSASLLGIQTVALAAAMQEDVSVILLVTLSETAATTLGTHAQVSSTTVCVCVCVCVCACMHVCVCIIFLKFPLHILLHIASCTSGDTRLVGGDDNNGRLEICTDGKWGTVCSDQFDYNDAIVICRQLNKALSGTCMPVL